MGTTLLSMGTLLLPSVSDISPQTLEALVKLAGVGTAGICILGLFVAGIITSTLPNDVSQAKLAAVKMFKNLCITVAIICLASSALASYFNLKKVDVAKQEATKAKNEVIEFKNENANLINRISLQDRQMNDTKAALEGDIMRLQQIIASQPAAVSMETRQTVERINATVREMRPVR
jgi:hypothetical protein